MAEGFWISDVGLRVRMGDLSRLVVTRTFNRALQMHAKEAGVKNFKYTTANITGEASAASPVCVICLGFEGNTYRAGQFMPYLPRHPNCRCTYDIYVEPTITMLPEPKIITPLRPTIPKGSVGMTIHTPKIKEEKIVG